MQALKRKRKKSVMLELMNRNISAEINKLDIFTLEDFLENDCDKISNKTAKIEIRRIIEKRIKKRKFKRVDSNVRRKPQTLR